MSVFTHNDKEFLLDGKPFQILSGAIHYFRTVPEYWDDRLEKLRQCGFNTVETYTCWNLHERREGAFDFSGILDLGRFIDIAAGKGLYCIVRPGPYICAEWDLGGLPSWLLNYRGMRIRCADEVFMEKEFRYLDRLFEILRPRLITNGGNVIMLQVENEYGSYGNDHEYIERLAAYYREKGMDALLFTSDGPGDLYIGGGTSKHLLATANFGSGSESHFEYMRQYRPDQPLMCAEFWEGWFDWWYGPHHRRTPDDVAQELDKMLSAGASVNFYMFCGGTNFGFHNGANEHEHYTPTATSYDYDAALTECGDLTKRFFEVRDVAQKHFGKLPELTVENTKKKAYGKIVFSEYAALLDNLDNISKPVKCAYPLTMEELGVDFGFTLYSALIDYPVSETINIEPVRDRAIVFIDGVFAGIKERDQHCDEIKFTCLKGQKRRIDILVENMGRVNYGFTMTDNLKGLVNPARLGQQNMFGWTMYPLPMEELGGLKYLPLSGRTDCPAFFRGELVIGETPCDTFLRPYGFEKGFVLINGFNIGRYWNSPGPQKTLYVPAPILRKGTNEIVICELSHVEKPQIEFCDEPDLG